MKYFKLETDKPALSYKVGEKMIFKITARDHAVNIDCRYLYWTFSGDDGKQASGISQISKDKPLILETSCDRPGFVHLYCRAIDEYECADESFEEFNGGAGAEPEKILYHDDLPADYNEFWNKTKNTINNFTPVFTEKKKIEFGVKSGFECFDVRVSTPLGRSASGYLSIPSKPGKFPIKLYFIGYRISGADMCFEDDTITFVINAHGIENGITGVDLKKMYPELCHYGFDNQENQTPKSCYWYGMIIRDLCAAKAARTLECWDGKTLTVNGGSQGAFQALSVAAHDSNITAADVTIPWFCDLNAENCGYQAGWRPTYAQGLRYFDTVAAGMSISCPVRVRAYLGDYVCPPATVMALYNSIRSIKEITFVQGGTHSYRHPEPIGFLLTSQPKIRQGHYKMFDGNHINVEQLTEDESTGEKYIVYRKDCCDKLFVKREDELLEMIYIYNSFVPIITKE